MSELQTPQPMRISFAKKEEPTQEAAQEQESSLTQEGTEQASEEQPQEQAEAQPEQQQEVQQEQEPTQESDSGNDEAVDLTDEVAISHLSETLGENISTLDELEEYYKNKYSASQQFASDEIKVINDFIANTGRTVQEYFQTQTTNYDELGDIDVLFQKAKAIYPEASEQEIKDWLETEYKTNAEEYSEREVNAAKFKLRADAKQAREEFKKWQDTYRQPVQQKEQKSEIDPKVVKQGVTQATKELNSIAFDEVEGWSFGVTDEMKQLASETVASMSQLELSRYADQNGNINYKEAVAEQALLLHVDVLVKGAIEHGKSLAAKEYVTEKKNINLPNQPVHANTNEKPAVKPGWQQLAELSGRNRGGLVIKSNT